MSEQTAHELAGDDWAGEMGDKWNAHLERFESMIGPVGAAALEFAEIVPGETVLDVGSGGGATTFDIAELVGPAGHATGLDLSPALVETARRRAASLGFDNVDFVLGDAAAVELERRYDCLFSRFGLMFFGEPYAAFAHMHGFVRPGGRVRFCCWTPPEDNAWVAEIMAVPRRYVEVPEPEDPRAPGPFAFGDADYVRDVLTHAGFGEVELTRWTGEQLVGGAGATPEEAARFVIDVLFVGDLLEDASDATRTRVYDELVALLDAHRTERGISMGASAWLVSATA